MANEYRDHAKILCKDAVELIEHILIKHDSTIIEEMHVLVKRINALESSLKKASDLILEFKSSHPVQNDSDYELISKANKFIENQSF